MPNLSISAAVEGGLALLSGKHQNIQSSQSERESLIRAVPENKTPFDASFQELRRNGILNPNRQILVNEI